MLTQPARVNDCVGDSFSGSERHKQLSHDRDFLLGNIESFQMGAHSDLERRFLELATATNMRVHETPTI